MIDERKIYEVVARLEQDTNQDHTVNEIYTTLDILKETRDKEETQRCLTALQRINDKLYESYGLRDSILDFQVCINTLRNEYDLPDEGELVVHAVDGDFAQ